jgi:hypothetical protein
MVAILNVPFDRRIKPVGGELCNQPGCAHKQPGGIAVGFVFNRKAEAPNLYALYVYIEFIVTAVCHRASCQTASHQKRAESYQSHKVSFAPYRHCGMDIVIQPKAKHHPECHITKPLKRRIMLERYYEY